MTSQTLDALRKTVQGLFALGLRFASLQELSALTRGVLSARLEQPASLVEEIRQHLLEGSAEKNDVETLIKVYQIISQAEIWLSKAGKIERERLTAVQGCHSLYIRLDEHGPQHNLDTILAFSNSWVRGHQLARYFQIASYDKLVQAVDIVWFDYSLSNFIVAGLCERQEEAVNLARIALQYKKNLVMQRTALKVLESVGTDTAFKQKVLEILNALKKESKAPLTFFIIEAIARIADRYGDHSKARQERFSAHIETVQQLSAPGLLIAGKLSGR